MNVENVLKEIKEKIKRIGNVADGDGFMNGYKECLKDMQGYIENYKESCLEDELYDL